MDKFLKQVAHYIIQKHTTDIDTLTVVFPNRRAGLFFQKYLSELIHQPIFSPNILTISELVSSYSGLKLMDQNRLVVELFDVYRKVINTTETLDDFFYWGEMLLADFNDIDKYLIDARQLFSNIESLREIDAGFDYLTEEQLAYLSTFWSNILNSRDSDDKKKFVAIWKNLFSIYKAFAEKLEKNQNAYEGLMYRKMANQLSDTPEIDKTSKFIIVGFNALNSCELKLFNYLKNNTSTKFLWDYDQYYQNAHGHEASLFMSSNLKAFPLPPDFEFSDDHFSSLKEIDVVAVPGFSGQASYASNWIANNSTIVNNRFDNTAVVLCDETLLPGMLNVLPAGIGEFNITMGFPIKNTPVYALVKGLVDIDRNSRPNQQGETIFYYRNVMGLLSNPLLKTHLGGFVEELLQKVKEENKIYLTVSDFAQQSLLSTIFSLPADPETCRLYIQQIVKTVFTLTGDEEKILKESLYQLYLATNRLHDSLTDSQGVSGISKKLYYQLLLRQLDRLMIPFEGEPLSGMQIMGFLETRNLDFDNLVLLSFNDDKLPGNPHQHSFIPYSLRKGFGLPVIEQRNAMYAYYFYRLIQRAKKVTLVYDSRTEGMTKGEVSRFATQLIYEAKHLKINEKQAVFDFEPAGQKPIEIVKTNEINNLVLSHLQNKRISPSALNTYIDCKLKFYLKYIEGIAETDDIAEDIDHLLFGRIAHVALEMLYQPFLDKEIKQDDIKRIITDGKALDRSLRHALEQEYFKGGSLNLNGRNLLVFDIIKKYLLRILKYDLSIAPFTLLGLEKKYEKTFNFETSLGEIAVLVGGTVDRIDRVGEIIRVVDYKTGEAKQSVSEIGKLFYKNSARNKVAFQTLVYAGCVVAETNPLVPVLPAVYGARSVFLDDFDPLFTIAGGYLNYQANAVEFENGLKQLLGEMVDPEVPFSQTDDEQMCKYCQYNGICNR